MVWYASGLFGSLAARCLERGDCLVELALVVVVRREAHVDRRIVRLGVLRRDVHALRFLGHAGVVVEPGQHEVVRRVAGLELDHVLQDRLGLAWVVELVGAVRGDEILQRELAELLVFRVRRDAISLSAASW